MTHRRLLVRLLALAFAWGCLSVRPAAAGFIDHLADASDIGPAKVPHLGHSRILVIPVNLDAEHRPPIDMAALTRFFTERSGRLSFPGYFRDNSGGRFIVSVDVARPVTFDNCPIPALGDDCTPTRRDASALVYGVPLVRTILKRAEAESALDFARYDLNGPQKKPDGWADGVVLIVNGAWFGVALPFGLLDPELTLVFDGVKVTMAAIASGPEALPMAIHEFGHLLGLADLYDEWGLTYGLGLSAMGSWRYGRDAPLLDPFSRMQLGWAEVEQVSGTIDALIPPALSGKVYKLGTGDEFFLVENRQPQGPYDRNVKRPGLAIYHVDLARLPRRQGLSFVRTVVDCPNCRPWRPFIMNVPADRRYEIQYRLAPFEPADLFRTGDAFLPIPRQTRLSAMNAWFGSNTYAGRPTEISVTRLDSDSFLPYLRATLSAPALADPCAGLRCPEKLECRAGRCQRPLFVDPEPSAPAAATLRLPDPEADAFLAFAFGPETGCLEETDWRWLSFLPLAAWLALRNRLRRRYEARLRKKGGLGRDEQLKNRF